MTELRNDSEYNFDDISSEVYRVYEFGDETVRIDQPEYLAVSDSGHRILDEDGESHYIPYGWSQIRWRAADGEPHFVK